MKMLIPAVGALTLALALPQLADAQDRGEGRGRGQDKGGHDDGRERGRSADAGPQEREVRRAARADDRPGNRPDNRPDNRPVVRPAVRSNDRPEVVFFRASPDRGLIAGCPPGLARKDNGCLPPGQARRIARDLARYDYVWGRRDDYRYRYDDGYLYRYTPQGSLMGWLPVLGGALGLGSVWPAQYQYQPAPTYYVRYNRLPDRYDYRYADGVLYGVDPQTRAISQVAALLTGQSWNVGQAMPVGYDVYNVPYDYRDRYADTPDRWYRYSDGYVYQVDPTTRLVQAVVQLLA